MAAVAALLASCSKDDAITGVSKSQVTFTVSAPEMETRAGEYGNGTHATTLYYAVYDAVEGTSYVEGLSNTNGEDFTGGKKEVTLNLVEGRTYDIIFYAQNAVGSPYGVNWANRTLSIDDPSTLTANNENYDAFYAHVDALKVGTAAINETVYLRRPFAQLNILTTKTDLDLGAKAGIDISTTAVTVKNIYTKMNLFTDQVDPASETAVTYGAANVLIDDVNANGTAYRWLSMNYLLVNAKKMVDVEFTMTDSQVADDKDATLVRNYTTVPVERNHRTNIYGSIITNPTQFKVEIVPGFEDPEHVYDVDATEEIVVKTAADLQEAIDNAKAGRTIIKFANDIDGTTTTRAATNEAAEIWVAQKDDTQIVIDGCNYEFNGTFKVHGNSGYRDGATLDFVNINFKTSTSNLNFIHGCDLENHQYRYSQNITVSDCTFETVNNPTDVVGVHVKSSKNLHIINCTAKNMHSLMQAQSCDDKILVENVTIENCSEGGVAFGNTAYPTIKNSTIVADHYGIRADGEANRGNLVIENVNITAKAPIVIRRASSTYSVALKGKNTLTSTGLYDVVFTNGGDDAAYVAPTGNWSITGAEGLTVYPLNLAVSNVAELENALKSLNASFSPIIKFVNNITVEKEWEAIKTLQPVVIDGNNHTLSFTGQINDRSNFTPAFRFENDAEIFDLTIDMSVATPKQDSRMRAISAKANLTLNNCEFVGNASQTKTRGVIFGEGAGNAISNVEVSITGCKFTNWVYGITDNENGQDAKVVEIVDNEFNDASVNVSAYNSIVFTENTMNDSGVTITSYTSADTAKVQATNNTLDADAKNQIGTKNHKFTPANVKAQAGFNVYYTE